MARMDTKGESSNLKGNIDTNDHMSNMSQNNETTHAQWGQKIDMIRVGRTQQHAVDFDREAAGAY